MFINFHGDQDHLNRSPRKPSISDPLISPLAQPNLNSSDYEIAFKIETFDAKVNDKNSLLTKSIPPHISAPSNLIPLMLLLNMCHVRCISHSCQALHKKNVHKKRGPD